MTQPHKTCYFTEPFHSLCSVTSLHPVCFNQSRNWVSFCWHFCFSSSQKVILFNNDLNDVDGAFLRNLRQNRGIVNSRLGNNLSMIKKNNKWLWKRKGGFRTEQCFTLLVQRVNWNSKSTFGKLMLSFPIRTRAKEASDPITIYSYVSSGNFLCQWCDMKIMFSFVSNWFNLCLSIKKCRWFA